MRSSREQIKNRASCSLSPLSSPPRRLVPMATPVVGPSLTGVGRHWQTQLVLAVNFLKQLNRPIRLEDLAITSGIEALLHNYELLNALKHHDRVRYDDRTQLFHYKASLESFSSLSLSLLHSLRVQSLERLSMVQCDSHVIASFRFPSPISSCRRNRISCRSCDATRPRADSPSNPCANRGRA